MFRHASRNILDGRRASPQIGIPSLHRLPVSACLMCAFIILIRGTAPGPNERVQVGVDTYVTRCGHPLLSTANFHFSRSIDRVNINIPGRLTTFTVPREPKSCRDWRIIRGTPSGHAGRYSSCPKDHMCKLPSSDAGIDCHGESSAHAVGHSPYVCLSTPWTSLLAGKIWSISSTQAQTAGLGDILCLHRPW